MAFLSHVLFLLMFLGSSLFLFKFAQFVHSSYQNVPRSSCLAVTVLPSPPILLLQYAPVNLSPCYSVS
jgi:hypothetical protein